MPRPLELGQVGSGSRDLRESAFNASSSWASSVAQGGLENGEVGVAWSNDLDPHWKSPVVETDWHARNWMTGHRPRRDCLHPPVIGIHPPACDGLRPVSRFVEREHLRTWRKNVVIGLEHLRDGRVPVVAG